MIPRSWWRDIWRRIGLVALAGVSCGPVLPTAPSQAGSYDRSAWEHWIDEDGDCQDTRTEVLIAESTVAVTFADARRCRVLSGRWRDAYAGTIFTDPTALDADHLVALAEAYASGGRSWTAARRRAYANDLTEPWHINAVGASVNRQKGAQTPETWRPPNRSAWCAYAAAWRRIKTRWGLTLAGPEQRALREMEMTCAV